METTNIKETNKDEQILKERTLRFNKKTGPRVGDYLKTGPGEYDRFTYLWPGGNTMQAGGLKGSYYFSAGGSLSYSGSLNSGIKLTDIEETDEIKDGPIWFFHNNEAKAHNGAYFDIPCRVFKLKPDADISGLW